MSTINKTILAKAEKLATTGVLPGYLTTSQVSGLLHLAASHISRLYTTGKLPAYKAGTQLFFLPEDVAAFQPARVGNPHFGPGFGQGRNLKPDSPASKRRKRRRSAGK